MWLRQSLCFDYPGYMSTTACQQTFFLVYVNHDGPILIFMTVKKVKKNHHADGDAHLCSAVRLPNWNLILIFHFMGNIIAIIGYISVGIGILFPDREYTCVCFHTWLFSQLLTKAPCGMKESSLRWLVNNISRGVEHLHSMKITHRDLKPENIVIARKGPHERDVCISAPHYTRVFISLVLNGKLFCTSEIHLHDHIAMLIFCIYFCMYTCVLICFVIQMIYKIIDLGYAKELYDSSLLYSFVGTMQYLVS